MNAFFPVHKSSSATGASEQLLELLLLKELSAAGAFPAASAMGAGPGRSCTGGVRIFKISVPISSLQMLYFPNAFARAFKKHSR